MCTITAFIIPSLRYTSEYANKCTQFDLTYRNSNPSFLTIYTIGGIYVLIQNVRTFERVEAHKKHSKTK